MTITTSDAAVASADEVSWDLEPLLDDRTPDELFDEAGVIADDLEEHRGAVGELDAGGLAEVMAMRGRLDELVGRAVGYANLRYAADANDPELGALLQRCHERSAALDSRLLFLDLEWVAVPDGRAAELLEHSRLADVRHHLASARRYRPHVLSEPEERVLTETAVTGRGAWVRLFGDLISAVEVELPAAEGADGGAPRTASLEEGLSLLSSPHRQVRADAADAVTAGLAPGLRTRAFVFNTLLADKATGDRLRSYPTWISSRNLANEASDESVASLVEAVVGRYDLARRWYRLKSDLLGHPLADHDRMASVAADDAPMGWDDARDLVLDAYASFSGELAGVAQRFFDERWIDAAVRPGKRPGAFCSYTVASHHPYVLLNFTGRRRDALTLAHELGHGLHGHLARPRGTFQQWTPLTLAETASVFGETVTFERLLSATAEPAARLALLAEAVEGSIATVFRQVAMNRFEDRAHTERRQVGELSVERFGELWTETQGELFGDSVQITEGYRTWWSYIPHFMGTPGYVYAYAYGQLLALSVYARYRERGEEFVPSYLDLLRAGGSLPPAELGRLVDCDLADPGFWDAGLDIIARQVDDAEAAARAAGRL